MSSDLLPRLRRNLRFIPQVQDGRAVYVVKDPATQKYFRFGEMEGWLMQRMDGSRSFTQIAAQLSDYLGKAVSAASIEPFYRRLAELGITERTQAERSVLLLERLRAQRKLRISGHGNTLLRMRFSFGDPDQLFNRIVPRIGFFWTPAFVIASVLAFAVYALILSANWSAFTAGILRLYQPSQYTAGFIATLYLAALLSIAIHELGHGLTCKKFGGEVHEMGAMLFYFSPAFFCNVNDAWTLEKKSHRLWVTFAGGWIQLVFSSIAGIAWILLEPGTFPHDFAFATVLIGGGLALVLNFNPLIPLDGYYALIDYVEIPNLRARSFAYLRAHLQKGVLRQDVSLPPVTPRESRIFLLYGSLAFIYTSFVILAFASLVGGVVVRRFEAWGWVIVIVATLYMGRHVLRRAGRLVRSIVSGPLTIPQSRRGIVLGAGGVSLLVLVCWLVPWTSHVSGAVIVEPKERVWLRPADDGWLEAISVNEGAQVQPGEVIAVLRNPDIELEWTQAKASIDYLRRGAAAALARSDAVEASRLGAQFTTMQHHFADLDRRREQLILRAPAVGVVVSPHLDERLGERVAMGDSLIEVWTSGPMRARVIFDERDVGEIRVGSPLGLKFPVRPTWTWRTTVESIGSAAREGQVEIYALLETSHDHASRHEHPLRPGMLGEAKVAVRRTNVALALLHWFRRTVRTDWLL